MLRLFMKYDGTLNSQLRSYNEQAIVWILDARPDLIRKPEKKKPKKELPLPLQSEL